MTPRPLDQILSLYDPRAPLPEAWTIPADWYTDPRVERLERRTVFSRSWQVVGRADQVAQPGQYITAQVAGEPILVVRGTDSVLRGFFNVCRHHAAAVMTQAEGTAQGLRCPYHGWTYSLDGQLKGTPDFAGVERFERSANGLAPAATGIWEKFVFVRLDPEGPSLADHLADLFGELRPLKLDDLQFVQRRVYSLDCNWKVFVDNYLDGGYHVPHLHKGLDSVLDYSQYTIINGRRHCLQSSPISGMGSGRAEQETAAVRRGSRALYYWLYPNFMINWYEGAMDTNLVIPHGTDRTEVVFDFYFPDASEASRAANMASIAVSHRIQEEDLAICASVQRGLASRAYKAGRLSVRREAGEHLFHRLLCSDLRAGLEAGQGEG